jgi:hypothetical protein
MNNSLIHGFEILFNNLDQLLTDNFGLLIFAIFLFLILRASFKKS